jgi:hypothetical protein
MKPLVPILALCLAAAIFMGGFYWGRNKPVTSSQPLRLEQILSIKELHLVKHVYQDLFFLHKKNDQSKSIRAIVQVPVEITAYLNLKEIEIVYQHDSIKQVVLPRAVLNTPLYKVDQIVIQQTHKFQIHIGRDLYPEVGVYMSAILKERMDTVRHLAAANRILVQAEEEGKSYIENLLKGAGRPDVTVRFAEQPTTNKMITLIPSVPKPERKEQLEALSFGFLPVLGNQ